MTSDLVARAAREVDRLVLGINRQVGPAHGAVLLAVARELGLSDLKQIPHFADFWLAGPLPREIAVARLPYAESRQVADRLDQLESLGLLSSTPGGQVPTDRFRPLLAGMVAARSAVIQRTWTGLESLLAEAGSLLLAIARAAADDHPVAALHGRGRPEGDTADAAYHDLVTVRYVRQHDHVLAWRGSGLTAAEMKVLTPAWLGEPVPDDAEVQGTLARGGLLQGTALTDEGRALRERIEADTNELNARTWSVLSAAEGERLVELLGRIPSSIS